MIKQIALQLTRNSPLNKGKSKDLSLERWLKILEPFSEMGVETCIIGGGTEPTLHPGFYDILQYCIDSFNSVVVETYGITETEFSNYDCAISIFFEDCEPEKHDSLFGKVKFEEDGKEILKSSFELAFRKLSVIKNRKFCRFPLHRSTDLLKSIVFAEKCFAGTRFIPSDNYVLNKNKLTSLFKTIKSHNERFSHSHRIEHPLYYLWNIDLHRDFINKFLKGVYINAEGKFFANPLIMEKFKLSDNLNINVIARKLANFEYEIKKRIGGVKWEF